MPEDNPFHPHGPSLQPLQHFSTNTFFFTIASHYFWTQRYLWCWPVRGLRVPSQAGPGHEPCSARKDNPALPCGCLRANLTHSTLAVTAQNTSLCLIWWLQVGKLLQVSMFKGSQHLHYTRHYTDQGLLSCGLSAGRNHGVTSTAETFNSKVTSLPAQHILFEGRLKITQAGECSWNSWNCPGCPWQSSPSSISHSDGQHPPEHQR